MEIKDCIVHIYSTYTVNSCSRDFSAVVCCVKLSRISPQPRQREGIVLTDFSSMFKRLFSKYILSRRDLKYMTQTDVLSPDVLSLRMFCTPGRFVRQMLCLRMFCSHRCFVCRTFSSSECFVPPDVLSQCVMSLDVMFRDLLSWHFVPVCHLP